MSQIVILLATFNGELYIREQLNSLLNQTIPVKILIHDDGSVDETKNIIKQYGNQYSDRIFILSNDVVCHSAKDNFQYLLSYAKNTSNYSYFMFCDQDDVWYENKVEKTLSRMLEVEGKIDHPIPVLIHADLALINDKNTLISPSFFCYQKIQPEKVKFNSLLVQNFVTGCTMMINKSLAEKCHSMPQQAIMHDWWIALIASAFGEIHCINEPVMSYRQHVNNQLGASGKGAENYFTKIKSKLTLDKYYQQAKAFLNEFSSQINGKNKVVLLAFVTSYSRHFIYKKMILIRHKIFKQSKLDNLGLFLLK